MEDELILVDLLYVEEEEFEINPGPRRHSLSIYVDEEKPLEEQLKNRERFDSCTNYFDEYYKEEENKELKEKYFESKKYFTEHFDSLLDSVEYIRLLFNETDDFEFIKNNPLILSKKIVLNKGLNITDEDRLMELIDKYKEMPDKIHVCFEGNDNYVSLLDCYKTINAIKKQAEDIKKLGLSPMETVMYAYDQVRNRIYTFEDKDESYHKSRDLTEVMFGDKIVCLGYANVFRALLNYIGIKNDVVFLKDMDFPENGHARNVAYIKDDKYGIDGVYYFDPTWDSKTEEENNEYLNNYQHFAMTKNTMDEYDLYSFEEFSCPKLTDDLNEKIKLIMEKGEYKKLKDYTKTLNYMSWLVTGARLIDPMCTIEFAPMYGDFDHDEFLKKFDEVFSKYNKEIPGETMLKLYSNVRKIEYYQNHEMYRYSLKDVYRTFYRSGWELADKHLTAADKIMEVVFGEEIEPDPVDNFRNYGQESGMFKEMEKVRLTKTLSLIRDKKTSSNK